MSPDAGHPCTQGGCTSHEGAPCEYVDRRGRECRTAWCPEHRVTIEDHVYCRRHAGVVSALPSLDSSLAVGSAATGAYERLSNPAINAQLAALAGAEVTGVVGRPERAAGLSQRGAAAVITNIEEAEGTFDLIVESVGGASLAGAISKVAPGGAIVVFGNSSREDTSISFSNFAGHAGAHLIAFFIYNSGTPASMGVDLAALVSLVAAEKLIPAIGLEESWHNLYRATTALRDRNVNGKAVFHID